MTRTHRSTGVMTLTGVTTRPCRWVARRLTLWVGRCHEQVGRTRAHPARAARLCQPPPFYSPFRERRTGACIFWRSVTQWCTLSSQVRTEPHATHASPIANTLTPLSLCPPHTPLSAHHIKPRCRSSTAAWCATCVWKRCRCARPIREDVGRLPLPWLYWRALNSHDGALLLCTPPPPSSAGTVHRHVL